MIRGFQRGSEPVTTSTGKFVDEVNGLGSPLKVQQGAIFMALRRALRKTLFINLLKTSSKKSWNSLKLNLEYKDEVQAFEKAWKTPWQQSTSMANRQTPQELIKEKLRSFRLPR